MSTVTGEQAGQVQKGYSRRLRPEKSRVRRNVTGASTELGMMRSFGRAHHRFVIGASLTLQRLEPPYPSPWKVRHDRALI